MRSHGNEKGGKCNQIIRLRTVIKFRLFINIIVEAGIAVLWRNVGLTHSGHLVFLVAFILKGNNVLSVVKEKKGVPCFLAYCIEDQMKIIGRGDLTERDEENEALKEEANDGTQRMGQNLLKDWDGKSFFNFFKPSHKVLDLWKAIDEAEENSESNGAVYDIGTMDDVDVDDRKEMYRMKTKIEKDDDDEGLVALGHYAKPQRYDIVNGVVKVDGVKGEAATDDSAKEGKGVPDFWLTAMKINEILAEEISERDEEALKYLKDIKWCRMDDPKGFKLEFFFDTNPFFKNSVLTKVYHMIDDDEPILEKAIGTTIEWLPGKLPEAEEAIDEEEAEELQNQMEQDYDIGSTIRDKIIPHDVTGRMVALDMEVGLLNGKALQDMDYWLFGEGLTLLGDRSVSDLPFCILKVSEYSMSAVTRH
ncbi:nucleosome assembly protein 1;4-like protein isoform X2 [Tanacetum coccineum]|uniref:Nucleosome assembly protein 14-like protein isoform X2 n=1 Tax=Tanacetum coccineum TaxID=301880 RepID=A0ABQ4ZA50_9ASTR